jgi:chaperonin cofactor prefoldin
MQTETDDVMLPGTTRSQLRELERRVVQIETQLVVARREELLAQAALDSLRSLAPDRQAAHSVGKCFALSERAGLENEVLREQQRARDTVEKLSELKPRFEEKLVAFRETLEKQQSLSDRSH